MCKGAKCPIKDTCFRYKATPNEFYQSWFINPPIENNKCSQFWEMPHNNINTLNHINNNDR